MQRIKDGWAWIGDQFTAIDASCGALTRIGPPSKREFWVVGLSAFVLIFMQYVILSPRYQAWLGGHLMVTFDLAEGLTNSAYLDRMVLMEHFSWAIGCVVFYLVIPALAVRLVLKRPLSDFGLSGRGYWKHARIYAAMFVPLGIAIIFLSSTQRFQDFYPFYRNPESLMAFVIWELAYAAQFVSLEFFFRGFMVHGLKERYGTGAIWMMLFPYCMIHFRKLPLETCAALGAGVILGLLSLRTRSIWGGASIHIAVAWTMDTMALWRRDLLQNLF